MRYWGNIGTDEIPWVELLVFGPEHADNPVFYVYRETVSNGKTIIQKIVAYRYSFEYRTEEQMEEEMPEYLV